MIMIIIFFTDSSLNVNFIKLRLVIIIIFMM